MNMLTVDWRMVPRQWWRRTAMKLGLLAAVFLMLFPAPQTNAQQSPVSAPDVVAVVDGGRVEGFGLVAQSEQERVDDLANELLPGQRWYEGFSTFHTRYGAGPIDDTLRKAMGGATGIIFGLAQFLTGARTNLLTWAMFSSGSVLQPGRMDEWWVAIADAITESGVFVIAVIFAVFSATWAYMFRNKMMSFRSVFKDVFVALGIMFLFGGLAQQAQASVDGNGGDYSPGNLTQTLVGGIDSLAAAPAAAVSGALDSVYNDDDPVNVLSCVNVVNTMRDRFSTSAGRVLAGPNAVLAENALVPSSLIVNDRLTMSTLGRAWSLAQGGDTPMFQNRSCLLLEWNSQTQSPTAMQQFFRSHDDVHAARWGAINVDAYNMRSNQEQDVRFIAWMSCGVGSNGQPVKTDPFFAATSPAETGIDKNPDKLATACTEFINISNDGDSKDGGSKGGPDAIFDYEEGNFPSIAGPTVPAEMIDTVQSWQGYRQGNNFAASLIAFATSLMLLIVIGFGAVGCIAAGLRLTVGIPLAGPVVLALAAFPGRSDTARKFGKSTLFAAAARALFILQLSMLAAIGQATLEFMPPPDGMWGVFWIGLAWLGAAAIVHVTMSKAKMPSTLSPSGAFAFGAGSVAGGAVAYSAAKRSPGQAKNAAYQRRRRQLTKRSAQERRSADGKPSMSDKLLRRNKGANKAAGDGTGKPVDAGTGTKPAATKPGRWSKKGAGASAGVGIAAGAVAARTKAADMLRGRQGSARRVAADQRSQQRDTNKQARTLRRDHLDTTRQQRSAESQRRRDERNRQTGAAKQNVRDAKWEQRRTRVNTALDGAADRFKGKDMEPGFEDRVAERNDRRRAAKQATNDARFQKDQATGRKRRGRNADITERVKARTSEERGRLDDTRQNMSQRWKRSRWSDNG